MREGEEKRSSEWSGEERFAAVMETHAVRDEEVGAWWRRRGPPHLSDTVGDGREAPRPDPARADDGLGLVAPEVAVASGLGESVPGVEQSWAGDEPRVDRSRESIVGASGVANCREPSLQRRFQVPVRVLREQGFGHALDRAEIGACGKSMRVGIDEARHQRAAL